MGSTSGGDAALMCPSSRSCGEAVLRRLAAAFSTCEACRFKRLEGDP